jgi:hypothetical protein
VTEAWSGDHFQLEMALLGSPGRQYTKKYLKLKHATFEGGFFHVFMVEKKYLRFFENIVSSALKSCIITLL